MIDPSPTDLIITYWCRPSGPAVFPKLRFFIVMARFTVILPEGSVLLKNASTGETLRLSAEGGPLVLGEIEMTMTLEPAPFKSARTPVSPAETSPPAPAKSAAEQNYLEAQLHRAFGGADVVRRVSAPEGLVFDRAYEKLAAAGLPPGFGPNEGEPFMSPAEPLSPETDRPEREFVRVLDAPLDALTASDFEETLDAMALRRNNIEGEIEYLEEIEADQTDIEELQAEMDGIDARMAEVLQRQSEFEALPKKLGLRDADG